MAQLRDNEFITGLNRAIKNATGIKPAEKPPKNANNDYITYQRVANANTSSVVMILSLTYLCVSGSYFDSHNLGNSVVEAVKQWGQENEDETLGDPVLNGLNDDNDGAGNYICTVDIQVSYIRGE